MQPEPQPLNSPEDVEAIRRVIRQGGNPLVDTDVPRWEDQVGVSRIVNRRVVEIEPLPTPAQVLADMPLSEAAQRVVVESRDAIRNVLHGRDDRLLVIVGPCSVHDPRAALDYARRLSALNGELKDELLIVMRVYFEKPRTTVGWKGLINDPDIDGSHNIRKGLLLARRVLLGVLDEGVPAATEFLEPTSPQYIADAVSWGAIGARNTESQIHRQLASGLSMPIGFKNATDGSVKAAIGRDAGQPGLPCGAARVKPRPELRRRFDCGGDGRGARRDAGGLGRRLRIGRGLFAWQFRQGRGAADRCRA